MPTKYKFKSGRSQPDATSFLPPSTQTSCSVPGLPKPSLSVSSQYVISVAEPPHTPAQSTTLPSQSHSPSAIP